MKNKKILFVFILILIIMTMYIFGKNNINNYESTKTYIPNTMVYNMDY